MNSTQIAEKRPISDTGDADVSKVDLRVRKTRLALASALEHLLEKGLDTAGLLTEFKEKLRTRPAISDIRK